MGVTRSGPTGLNAPSHVDRELSVALVPAPIPYQRTVDTIVADGDKLRDCKYVTHTAVQVIALIPVLKRLSDFNAIMYNQCEMLTRYSIIPNKRQYEPQQHSCMPVGSLSCSNEEFGKCSFCGNEENPIILEVRQRTNNKLPLNPCPSPIGERC